MTPQHKDPILEEIWQIREQLAAEANYDLDVICKRQMERWGVAEEPKMDVQKTKSES